LEYLELQAVWEETLECWSTTLLTVSLVVSLQDSKKEAVVEAVSGVWVVLGALW
jgi:hypothetical protein